MIPNGNALLGYTGFVGSNILDQHRTFDFLYNSKNIDDIQGRWLDLAVVCAAPGLKWFANKYPEKDFASIQKLIESLKTIKASELVLISTVAVYPKPRGANEDTLIDQEKLSAYGKHRLLLENFVRDNFNQVRIIRLPGIFGPGIKKNIIYDLLHHDYARLIHQESIVQFYDLKNIWKDISVVRGHNLPLVNFGTKPVSIQRIAQECFDYDYRCEPDQAPVHDDMQTKYGTLWQKKIPYLYDTIEVLADLKSFVTRELAA